MTVYDTVRYKPSLQVVLKTKEVILAQDGSNGIAIGF